MKNTILETAAKKHHTEAKVAMCRYAAILARTMFVNPNQRRNLLLEVSRGINTANKYATITYAFIGACKL